MPNDVNQTPEEVARDRIDARLRAAGWHVQDKDALDFNAGLGIAVREYQTDVGPADYVLFVDREAVGVVEAKPDSWGAKLTTVEEQSEGYANANLKWVSNSEPLPFLYECTGQTTRFTNGRDPNPRSREVFTFHQPETFRAWKRAPRSLRSGIASLPSLNPEGLRKCQTKAIIRLEASLKADRPRALVQMATGSGKTYTAITVVYRLLKHAGARRVLFLVDTRNLGEQAEQEFMAFIPDDDNRKFTELYNVQRLTSPSIAGDVQVVISTIQRLYATLKGQDLAEGSEEEHPEERKWRPKLQQSVAYSAALPPEQFDAVIIDECHRSIYNLWRQVVEYFDAFLIGLTATPDNRTYGFFQKNVVSEYTHEEAVADKVNVGNEIYLIETQVTQGGETLEPKQLIEKRERLTRARRWAVQEERATYAASQLDRSVVNPDQIRTIIRAFRDHWPRIFPGRGELPKTLVFAKTDSHADDIIQTVRQEFGKGNEFCRKITNGAKNPKSSLTAFRNDFNPRIAVTVDMIATGTDVKPIECLLFMRDVKSQNYFEQMKGRGTRVLKSDELRKVTPSAQAKTHYVIVDAVGVTKSLKTTSQPLDTKPSIPLKDLAMSLMMGDRSEETTSSLAARLARLDHQLETDDQARIEQMAGKPLSTIVRDLFDAIDPDKVEADAMAAGQPEPDEPALQAAREERINQAANVFTGPLINLMDSIRRDKEQTIDHDNLDTLLRAEWAGDVAQNAKKIAKDFESYLRENRDEIEALTIYFTQPARRSAVTLAMIKDVLAKLREDRPRLAPLLVWRAYSHLDDYKGKQPVSDLTALVALIRRVCGLDDMLTRHSDRVKRNFQTWVLNRHAGAGEKFSEEQMEWLRMIRDHLETSFTIERDDLEMAPFDAHGGLGRMYALFGDGMDGVMAEMNEALAA
ncbi:MAG: DEAD/DEAH box helicase [Gammaproteobacteria bacterium]|nr:DEAD/DEAH box helicase [Gammaproteobacteria bacterium]MYH16585.1 DEAD/DEAH box helicase [Gammaproteobacteria bacterium]MYK81398.1 DEAD/DEAH box helicase [Gammaproteobacteria bacterium]